MAVVAGGDRPFMALVVLGGRHCVESGLDPFPTSEGSMAGEKRLVDLQVFGQRQDHV